MFMIPYVIALIIVKLEGGGGGYLSQENNKNAGEMKLNVAGIVDREELFQ